MSLIGTLLVLGLSISAAYTAVTPRTSCPFIRILNRPQSQFLTTLRADAYILTLND